jgi:phage tail tube protein FII
VVTFNTDGSLSYRDAATEELAQRMKAIHKEVGNGTFKPNRENDQLPWALGNKEHPDNWEALSPL